MDSVVPATSAASREGNNVLLVHSASALAQNENVSAVGLVFLCQGAKRVHGTSPIRVPIRRWENTDVLSTSGISKTTQIPQNLDNPNDRPSTRALWNIQKHMQGPQKFGQKSANQAFQSTRERQQIKRLPSRVQAEARDAINQLRFRINGQGYGISCTSSCTLSCVEIAVFLESTRI